MSLYEFYAYRCGHFFQAAADYIKHQNEQNQYAFELQRLLATTLVNVQLKQEDRVTPAQLWDNPYDHEDGKAMGSTLSEEQQIKMDKALEKALADKLNNDADNGKYNKQD